MILVLDAVFGVVLPVIYVILGPIVLLALNPSMVHVARGVIVLEMTAMVWWRVWGGRLRGWSRVFAWALLAGALFSLWAGILAVPCLLFLWVLSGGATCRILLELTPLGLAAILARNGLAALDESL